MNKINKPLIMLTAFVVLIVVVAVFTSRAGYARKTDTVGEAAVGANVAPPAQEPRTILAYDQILSIDSSVSLVGPVDVSKFKQIRVVLIHLTGPTDYGIQPRILSPDGLATFNLESNSIQPALENLGGFQGVMRVYTPLCENIVFVFSGSPGALIQILVYGREN